MRRAGLDPLRIENAITVGMSDVVYQHGWVELKWAANWPKRGGPLKLAHFTAEQSAWIVERVARGWNADIVLHVGNDWCLIPGGPDTLRFWRDGILREDYLIEGGVAGVVWRLCDYDRSRVS